MICNCCGVYLFIEEVDLVIGWVIGYKDGFGFLVLDDGGLDLFLIVCQMCLVFYGDCVVVWVDWVDECGCWEGKIVEVLEYWISQMVGCFFQESGIIFVVLENVCINYEVLVFVEYVGKVCYGQYVVVDIIQQFMVCI